MINALVDTAIIDLQLSSQDAASLNAIARSALRISAGQGVAICLVGQDEPVCVAAAGVRASEAKAQAQADCKHLQGLQLAQLQDQAVMLKTRFLNEERGGFPFCNGQGGCLGTLAVIGREKTDQPADIDLIGDLVQAISPLLLRAGARMQFDSKGSAVQSQGLQMLMSSMPGGLHGSRSAEDKLAVLMAAARDIIHVRNIEDLQWHVAEEVVAKLGFIDCLIYRYVDETKTLHQVAAIGEKTPTRGVILNPLIIPINRGITGAVATTKEPLLLADAGQDPRYVYDLMEPGAELCVPILHEGRLLGVIDCEHPQKGWFCEDDLQMLTAIASLMASQWVQCELTGAIRDNARRLKKAERAAAAANQAKSVFVANMSHEIRTPLHGVLGAAQLLGRTELDERQGRFVEVIQAAGQNLLSIIEEILDISHIEAGGVSWSERPFDLAATVFGVSAGIGVLAKQKELEFSIEFDEALPAWVLGDPKRFGQILTNFLGNAVKFTQQGQVVLRLNRGLDGQIRIEVQDTGPGLTPEERAIVFDRFSRVDDEGTRKAEGSGLGLSICQEVVKAAGGRIGVDSEKGTGSLFWCELPLGAVAPPAERQAQPDMDMAFLDAANDREEKTILVVEDAETNRMVLRESLQQAGYRVLLASNGADAIKIVREGQCDAVLMDVRMPLMRGDSAIAEIRKLSGDAGKLPIFVLSGDVTPESDCQARRLGADAYFTKPLDLGKMQITLDSVLRGSGAGKVSDI
ncbi:MAG: response regulator [Alphaproteobacteria bacterium]|nr:response regulator [Alphaproteobacteria bacterium]